VLLLRVCCCCGAITSLSPVALAPLMTHTGRRVVDALGVEPFSQARPRHGKCTDLLKSCLLDTSNCTKHRFVIHMHEAESICGSNITFCNYYVLI